MGVIALIDAHNDLGVVVLNTCARCRCGYDVTELLSVLSILLRLYFFSWLGHGSEVLISCISSLVSR